MRALTKPILALLALAAPLAAAQTRTFTLDADFDTGTLNNVRHNPISNQLILGRTGVSQTRIVWVSNTSPGGVAPTPLSPGWILRLDTTPGPNLGRQTARFDAALMNINGQPTGHPCRTTTRGAWRSTPRATSGSSTAPTTRESRKGA